MCWRSNDSRNRCWLDFILPGSIFLLQLLATSAWVREVVSHTRAKHAVERRTPIRRPVIDDGNKDRSDGQENHNCNESLGPTWIPQFCCPRIASRKLSTVGILEIYRGMQFYYKITRRKKKQTWKNWKLGILRNSCLVNKV